MYFSFKKIHFLPAENDSLKKAKSSKTPTSFLTNCPCPALQFVSVPLQISAHRQPHCLFKKINLSCDCESWSNIAKER